MTTTMMCGVDSRLRKDCRVTLSMLSCSVLFSAAWGQMHHIDPYHCSICDAVEAALFLDIGAAQGVPGQYYLSRLQTNSYDAQYACSRIDGILAEMETENEFIRVTEGLEGHIVNHETIHIGGVINSPSRVVSSSQNPRRLLYTDWHNRQPRDDDLGRDCLSVFRRPNYSGIKMSAVNCTAKYGRFLCEL